jgi:hypothetical protein
MQHTNNGVKKQKDQGKSAAADRCFCRANAHEESFVLIVDFFIEVIVEEFVSWFLVNHGGAVPTACNVLK